MPTGEPNGYPQGHINRVYDFVIVPACRLAGYWPTRADNATYNEPLTAIKEMVDSEIVICDLSANNDNALYALAIRHALGLPILLVKDIKSVIAFAASELGVVEYDESLRIDTVQKASTDISEAIKKAMETKKERHELLDRLNIGLSPVITASSFPDMNTQTGDASESLTDDTAKTEEEDEEEPEIHYPIISPLPDYVGDPLTEDQMAKLKSGDVFFHLNHGRGTVKFVNKKIGKDHVAKVQFESGTKLLVLAASDFYRSIKDSK